MVKESEDREGGATPTRKPTVTSEAAPITCMVGHDLVLNDETMIVSGSTIPRAICTKVSGPAYSGIKMSVAHLEEACFNITQAKCVEHKSNDVHEHHGCELLSRACLQPRDLDLGREVCCYVEQ